MHPESFPFEWQGRTLYLSPLTADIKKQFCRWVEPRYIGRARKLALAPGLDEEGQKEALVEYQLARQEVFGGAITWTDAPCIAVAQEMSGPEGEAYLAKLLLGSQVQGWPDAELRRLVGSEPYREAFDLARETADPNPTAPVTGPSAVKTGSTDSSAPSAPSHSTCPAPTPAA